MSRENRIKDIKPLTEFTDLSRVGSIINTCLDELNEAMDKLEECNEEYFDAVYEYNTESTEDSEAGVQVTALALEEAWANTQYILSKYAVLMSIDGNEAFNKKVG